MRFSVRRLSNSAKTFYKNHEWLVNLILIALILRLAYLNAVATLVFDEGFYVPAANALLSGGGDINPEHPPLVKLILAASILVGGDNPLAWRIPAVIAGMASIALFYFVVLELTGNKRMAVLAAALLAFDPLHISMSRTGMLDIFMLAFALGGAYFLLKRDLFWAGILFGLGISSKWPAILPFAAVAAFVYLRKELDWKSLARVLGIMAAVYLAASSPFIIADGPVKWLSVQIYDVGKMTTMPSASELTSTAPEWLILQKPVWFARDRPDFDVPADMLWLVNLFGAVPGFGIVAFGNPITWFPGMFALAWLLGSKSRKFSKVRLFSLLWFACTYVPFLLIPRTHTVFYYMLLIIPSYFLALSQLLVEKKLEKWFLLPFAASVILFLPLLIGLPAPQQYYQMLKPLIGEFIIGTS